MRLKLQGIIFYSNITTNTHQYIYYYIFKLNNVNTFSLLLDINRIVNIKCILWNIIIRSVSSHSIISTQGHRLFMMWKLVMTVKEEIVGKYGNTM